MREYKRYKNGDRCPCCGQVLQGKSEDWLEIFSQFMYVMHLPFDNSQEDTELKEET